MTASKREAVSSLTAPEWDVHWYQIRDDLESDGVLPVEASVRADLETVEQFGPRPQETP